MIQKSNLVLVRKVNLKMRDQKCEAIRVLGGNANWEGFYWPQDVRVLDQKVLEMLQRLNLVGYKEVFKKQELSLIDVADMNHEDLQSIGISLVKHRKAILKYFQGRIKKSQRYVPLTPLIQPTSSHQRSHRLEERGGQKEVQPRPSAFHLRVHRLEERQVAPVQIVEATSYRAGVLPLVHHLQDSLEESLNQENQHQQAALQPWGHRVEKRPDQGKDHYNS